MTSVGYGAASELDERLVAKAALDAAEEQLQSLCASHAGAFVSVQRRSAALEQALEDLQISIKEAEPQVTNAQQSLDPSEDDKSLAQVSERHRVRRRTLLQHSALLELLELPSLMDACVRSNLYEQALAIAAFSNTLERRHGTASTEEKSAAAVVARVITQIRSRQVDLRRHLLHRLKGYVTMPQCLEVVTALRRLNSIDLERQQQNTSLERIHASMEMQLQVDFLEARDAWLDSAAAVPANGSSAVNKRSALQHAHSEHLLDTIERYRTRCFEIATQFLAIFRASPGASVAAASKHESSPSSLLSMWTTRRVHSFLSMLASQLNHMQDTASLRDALEACVFFATSMGRLGADFTALLPPLLEPKMLSLVVIHWTEGVAALAETLRVCRDAGVANPLVSSTASGVADDDMPFVDGKTPPPPPRQLLALPPLARFLNSYLTGLNELRRCLFTGIFSSLRNALEVVIRDVKQILQTNERAVLTPGLRGEATQLREVAARFKTIFDQVVEPYMRGALEVALGDYNAAKSILPKREKLELSEDVVGDDSQEVIEEELAGKEDQEVIEEVLAEKEEDETKVEAGNDVTAVQQPSEIESEHDTINATAEDPKPAEQGGWNDNDVGDAEDMDS